MKGTHEFEVDHMPVTVAVDMEGTSIRNTGPAEWRQLIVEPRTEREHEQKREKTEG